MEAPRPLPGNGSPAPHVLIMDDTQEVLDLLQELLLEEGYRVTCCQEVLELDMVKSIQPDVIVQDLLFAGTKGAGWSFLSMMRLDPDLAHIPVVLCTALNAVVRDGTMVGNLDRLRVQVVLKPFALDDLLATLKDSRLHATSPNTGACMT